MQKPTLRYILGLIWLTALNQHDGEEQPDSARGFDNDNPELQIIVTPRSKITITCLAVDAEKNELITRPSRKSGDEPSTLEAGAAIAGVCFFGMAVDMGLSWSAVWLAPFCRCLLGIMILVWFLRLALLLVDSLARALTRFLVYLSM